MKYNIDDLIYLCDHMDRYLNFRIDVELLLRGKSKNMLLSENNVLLNKQFNYFDKRVEELYYRYGNMAAMVLCSSTNSDVMSKLKKLNYMYEYILINKNKINDIKELLIKLKMLGFDEIIFDTYMKLTTEEFKVSVNYTQNKIINYLDNMMALPSIDIDTITYMSIDSDYKIELMVSSRYDKTLILRGSIIYLTSLVIDKDNLPDSLDIRSIYDKIMSLTYGKKKNLIKRN